MKKWLLAFFVGSVVTTQILMASMLMTRAFLQDSKKSDQSEDRQLAQIEERFATFSAEEAHSNDQDRRYSQNRNDLAALRNHFRDLNTETQRVLVAQERINRRAYSYRRDEMNAVYKRTRSSAAMSSEDKALNKIENLYLAGQIVEAKVAIERFNAANYAGGPVFLYDDPALAERHIKVRPVYNYVGTFSVNLQCVNEGQSKARVLVPPGATIRAPGKFQDVTVLGYQLLEATPKDLDTQRAIIACCELRDKDPRGSSPGRIESHQNGDVAKVALAAARLGSPWKTTQVAVWAVTDNPSNELLMSTPGRYRRSNVLAAQKLMEEAGLKPSKYRLWGGSQDAPTLRGLNPIRSVFGG
ncbi:MAG: hypothetical protein P1V97_05755 [Planctomycetota bacterium]|nr:hypothetical protein [Planctomycetota bacterium]